MKRILAAAGTFGALFTTGQIAFCQEAAAIAAGNVQPTGIVAALQSAKTLLENKNYPEAAAVVRRSLPSNKRESAASGWPLTDGDFDQLMSLADRLKTQNALSSSEWADLLRTQMRACFDAMMNAPDSEARAQLYGRWSNLRLKCLREIWLPRKQWTTAEGFTADGVSRGLAPFDATRERFWKYLVQAEHFELRDSLAKRKSRSRITAMRDRLPDGAARQRLERLLESGDEAALENEARSIKTLTSGRMSLGEDTPAKYNHANVFERVFAELNNEFDQAKSAEHHERACLDAIELAVRVERTFRSAPNPRPPELTKAFAFNERMGPGAHRLTMDSVYALALANRGDIAEASLIQKSVLQQLAVMEEVPAFDKAQIDLVTARVSESTTSATRKVLPGAHTATQTASNDQTYAEAAISIAIERAVNSDNPQEASDAIEAVALAYLKSHRIAKTMEGILALERALGDKAPSFKIAKVQLMKMWALAWNRKIEQAVAIADDMAQKYLNSDDPFTVAICADALCHAYCYTAQRLKDPVGAERYLRTLAAADPAGKYAPLVAMFRNLASGSSPSEKRERSTLP